MTAVFDKLAFVRCLEGEGTFSRAQAEALSEAVHGAVSETVATKYDLAELRQSDLAEIKHEMASFRLEVQHELVAVRGDIQQTRTDFGHQLRELRSELKLWTGSLVAAQFAALSGLAAALRFLGH